MIAARRFGAFVTEAMERRADDYLWQMWLHKCHDGTSFDRYKARLTGRPVQHSTTQAPSDDRVAEIVGDSLKMLEGFAPAR